jgi:SAM-dependent methyltransferase
MSGRLDFPATARNRDAIARVLAQLWDSQQPLAVLEVASGSGQHAAYFAPRFPHWTLQPSDIAEAHLDSIEAYREEASGNLLPPLALDVESPPWPLSSLYDAIWAINLIHISPWSCTEALFGEGRRHLRPRGSLYLYGAFRRQGQHTAPSNQAFDISLRQQNPAWGVRCLDEVAETAASVGFRLARLVPMPANNLSVLFTLE